MALGAYTHQELPFAKLVAELAPERNLSQTPLFQVQLVLAEADQEELRVPGLTLAPSDLEASTSKLDLTLRAHARPQGMELVWLYNTDLFDAATVRRLGDHFATLFAAAMADPDRALSSLPLMAAAEEHQVLAEWNDMSVPGWVNPEPGTLHAIIAEQAARTPGVPAVVYEGAALTYAELLSSARRLALRLRQHGVGPDVAVGVFAERSLEMVVGLLAILKAGGAYLPLDPALSARAPGLHDGGRRGAGDPDSGPAAGSSAGAWRRPCLLTATSGDRRARRRSRRWPAGPIRRTWPT